MQSSYEYTSKSRGMFCRLLTITVWSTLASGCSPAPDPQQASTQGYMQGLDSSLPVRIHGYDDGHRNLPIPNGCITLGMPLGVPLNGNTQFGTDMTDTWFGNTTYAACLGVTAEPSLVQLAGIETFSGTIVGCGTGTLTLLEFGTLDLNQNLVVNGTWSIKADGPQTGDFVGATGGGTLNGTLYLNLSSPFFFGGTMTCPNGTHDTALHK